MAKADRMLQRTSIDHTLEICSQIDAFLLSHPLNVRPHLCLMSLRSQNWVGSNLTSVSGARSNAR